MQPTLPLSLEMVLWECAPFILFAAVIAVSFVSARLVFVVHARSGHPQRGRTRLLAYVVGGIVFFGLIFGWGSLPVIADPTPVPFSSHAWRSRPWVRWPMSQHLIESGRLAGMSAGEVRQLLGDGDGSYDRLPQQSSENRLADEVGEVSTMDTWALYRPRDILSLMPPELVVTYDETGCVYRVWIVE